MLTEKEKKACRVLISEYKKKLKSMCPAALRCLPAMSSENMRRDFTGI